MIFSDFLSKIDNYKTTELGGLVSQFKLVPELRKKYSEEKIKNNNPRKAAVLALFYPDNTNQTRVLLTQRASYKGTHSAQVSFPGGKFDGSDINLQQTALREAFEEVQILPEDVTVIREITDAYIPPSNFLVTPFLAYTNTRPNFSKNYEVAELIEVLVADLLDDTTIHFIEMETSYMKKIKVPCFKLNGYIVWGATAMILSEIKDILQ